MKTTRRVEPPDWEEIQQLPFNLKLEDPEESDDAENFIRPEEAKRLSIIAKKELEENPDSEDGKVPSWFDLYLQFHALGYPWRVAGYMAWASTPKIGRQPETLEELATQYLGLKGARVIYTWRVKNPSIDEIVGYLQSQPLHEYRADFFQALAESASNPDYKHHQDRKLAFEMSGDHTPRVQMEEKRNLTIDNIDQLSDEILQKIADFTKENGDNDE